MSVCFWSISLHTLIFLRWFSTWMINFSQHILVFNSSNEVLIRVFFLVGTIFATAAYCSNFVPASILSVIVAIHSFIILESKCTAL